MAITFIRKGDGVFNPFSVLNAFSKLGIRGLLVSDRNPDFSG